MWTAKKLYFVCQYLEQFTRGMKNRKGFSSGLTYVDLFCGAGVSSVKAEGRVRRYPGSPMIAASTPNKFDRLVLADINESNLDATRRRLEATSFDGEVHLFNGDSNKIIGDIKHCIPPDSLAVAFIDPYSLDVHFETIRTLAIDQQMDLLVLFSDRFDLGRNVHKYYYPAEEQSKLDRFLGADNWKVELEQLGNQAGDRVRALFAGIYLERLRLLGYSHSDSWPLDGPQGPVFRLVYASKHELGLKYCQIAQRRDFEGNRGLFGV